VTEVAVATADNAPQPGLLARVIGVVLSPRETFQAVATRPRVLGVLLLTTLVTSAAQFGFLSSEVGRKASLDAIDQQVRLMEGFGATVTDEVYSQMTANVERTPYITAASILVFSPISALVLSAVFLGVFNGLLGGNARFKQVLAIVTHSGVVWMLVGLLTMGIGLLTGRATGSSRLSVFFPMLEETGFLAHFFGYVDLLWLWAFVNGAMGLAVLYKRRTGPIAMTLIALYLAFGVLYAAVTSFAGSS
jgi:Yip1-like protein